MRLSLQRKSSAHHEERGRRGGGTLEFTFLHLQSRASSDSNTHTRTDVERTKCSQSKKVSVFRPTDALFFFSNKPDGAIGAVQLGRSKKGGGGGSGKNWRVSPSPSFGGLFHRRGPLIVCLKEVSDVRLSLSAAHRKGRKA